MGVIMETLDLLDDGSVYKGATFISVQKGEGFWLLQ